MYRYLLLLLLCEAVAPAPQSMSDSDITYVMLQPTIEAPAAPSHYRESRIENLPLTIPGNATATAEREDINQTDRTGVSADKSAPDQTDDTFPESSNLSEVTALPESAAEKTVESVITDLPQPTDVSERTAQETGLPENTKPDEQPQTLPEITGLTEKDELLEAHGSDVSDTIPSETYQSERRGRTYDSSETTDIFDEATLKYEDVTQIPEIVEPRTRKTPKFVPKLSYFQKPQVFVSFPTNSIEKSAKRRFRSNCRCEKIWNCPKLQISVPRCPNEYFLCCF